MRCTSASAAISEFPQAYPRSRVLVVSFGSPAWLKMRQRAAEGIQHVRSEVQHGVVDTAPHLASCS